jgi:ornithine cyclodeaminase
MLCVTDDVQYPVIEPSTASTGAATAPAPSVAATTAGAGPRFLSAQQVRAALSLADATDALASGFRARAGEDLDGIPRTVLELPATVATTPTAPAGAAVMTGSDHFLLMPAHGPEGVGLKLVTIVPGNADRGLPLIQGVYVLMAPGSLSPELILDGAALTTLRTAAVTMLATRQLARPDSRRLVVFGAGVQAAVHVEAMRVTLPIEHVTIVGRTPSSASATDLVARLRADGIDAALGAADAVAGADVVCTCTTSTTPLFDAALLSDGTHVNAIGSYTLEMAELPTRAFERALLVVETVAATLVEAGDVVDAIKTGVLPQDGFARELIDVVTGAVQRTSEDQITIFKSVGLSVEDLIIARAINDAVS